MPIPFINKFFNTIITSITIFVLIAHFTIAFAQEPHGISGQLVEKTIASVDDYPIFLSELEREYLFYAYQDKFKRKPTKCQILENLIVNKMLLAYANNNNIYVTKEEVDKNCDYRIQYMLKEVGGSEAVLEQQFGKKIGDIKEELTKIIKEQMILDRVKDAIIGHILLTPNEVKEYFDALSTEEKPFYPAIMEAYQIILYVDADEQEKMAVVKQLKALKNQLTHGEKTFEALAKQYSQDPVSAAKGGTLGFFHIGELDPAYEKAALSLKINEISDPIETKFGFHLIQLIEKKGNSYHTRHILIKPRTASHTLDVAKEKLNAIRTSIVNGEITFTKAAILYSQDKETAEQGGLLTKSADGSLQLPADQLPSAIFFALERMQPGTISLPEVFQDKQGNMGIRIFYLKEKKASHLANFEQDYDKIHNMALAHKKQVKINKFLNRLKEKTIIQCDSAYAVCKFLGNKNT